MKVKEDVVNIYNAILLSYKKKNEILPSATRTDLDTILLSEITQKVKDKYFMISFACGI